MGTLALKKNKTKTSGLLSNRCYSCELMSWERDDNKECFCDIVINSKFCNSSSKRTILLQMEELHVCARYD